MILDSEIDFKRLQEDLSISDITLIPIFSDVHYHPKNNSVCLFYIQIMNNSNEYVVLLNHCEKIFDCDIINELIHFNHRIFTPNKKRLLFIYPFDNVIDTTLLAYISNSTNIEDVSYDTPAHTFFNRHFYEVENINSIIPVSNHIHRCKQEVQNMSKNIAKYSDMVENTMFKIYNDIVVQNFYQIESQGLKVDKELFKEYFPDKVRYHLADSDFVYSEYNLYTRTGRPANSYSGVNYAALNKDDGSRRIIQSRFDDGMLVEFDFSSYHMFLVARILDISIPSADIHTYMAQLILGKDNITPEEKSQMKQINFQLLYSDLDDSIIEAVPYYAKLDKFRNTLYKSFLKNGYIETHLFKRRIYMPIDSKAATVFNYYVQSYETEQNAIFIRRVTSYIQEKQLDLKMILYTYDSILFDIPQHELHHSIAIKDLLSEFPLKMHAGRDYFSMISVS